MHILNQYIVKPVYNEHFAAAKSFRNNRSIYKEMYAIGENDVLSYKRV